MCAAVQIELPLTFGFYRCHNCARLDAASVRKVGRFWLCDQCAVEVLPDFAGDATTADQRQSAAFDLGVLPKYWFERKR